MGPASLTPVTAAGGVWSGTAAATAGNHCLLLLLPTRLPHVYAPVQLEAGTVVVTGLHRQRLC